VNPAGLGTTAACEFEAAVVTYGPLQAVRGIDLRVAAGETVALIGSSGAGKTSVLRLLAGMVKPSAGAVRLFGTALEAQERRLPQLVGMMQQRLDLVGQLSVKHNVQAGALGRWGLLRSLGALVLPLEHPPARAAAERVGLAERFDTRVARLSGGEQQRVALARLLVQDPPILLADEPVASLDPARAADLVALLCALAREGGRTLVASIHAPELARTHFDRIVGLRAGRVVFDLPAAEVGPPLLEALYGLQVASGRPAAPTRPAPAARDRR
jgi:phosphonate transport system ATP-binding protein